MVGSPLVRGPGGGCGRFAPAVLCGRRVGATSCRRRGGDGRGARAQAEALRDQNGTLAAGSQSAQRACRRSRPPRADAEPSWRRSARARRQVGARRSAVDEELGIARCSSVADPRRLSPQASRRLYEQGDTDILAVLLGAGSLDAALNARRGPRSRRAAGRGALGQGARGVNAAGAPRASVAAARSASSSSSPPSRPPPRPRSRGARRAASHDRGDSGGERRRRRRIAQLSRAGPASSHPPPPRAAQSGVPRRAQPSRPGRHRAASTR